ncbi:MAG: DegT/DnrJ/EryC1/StrS aminotransferase family protein [Aquamicrobium sp.]|uniref:DegT/DnrJ/EryC1/StrS family aminotransferase n=1 Tax=Aquamicrobium sp. TaxID=1872579 RepID=UPI00349E5D00|nr:DegT/DnrJ/EryC1/StrS aminotransferase family protein [Aquamicrobium sp.]
MPIPFAKPDITEAEITAISNCLRSGWLTTGGVTAEFERRFAETVGAKYALAVTSATMGALLVLDALGIGAGDEVIVPAYTFSGPAMMARRLGARVVFADSRASSPEMSWEDALAKVTSRTKAIMPTDFAGNPWEAGIESLETHFRDIPIIHDAAHAFPAAYSDGSKVGSKGLATFFSFYATKTLTTGDGGMVTTNDDDLAARIRKLRQHGFNKQLFDRYTNIQAGWAYAIEDNGWKANLTDLASSVGLVQLERAQEMLEKRRAIASLYDSIFTRTNLPVRPLGHDEGSAFHLYPIYVENRDDFITRMAGHGIQCSVHFIPLPLHPAWQDAGAPRCLNAENHFMRTVSLPIYPTMAVVDVAKVLDAAITSLKEQLECSQA